MLEEPDLALSPERVLDGDLFQVDVAVEVDRVTEAQAEAELRAHERRIADEGLMLVRDVPVPPIVPGPRELSIHPEAEPRRFADRMVLLSDVRVIDVTQLVARIKRDEEVAVAEREIARHG